MLYVVAVLIGACKSDDAQPDSRLQVWICALTSANLHHVLAEGLHVWSQYYWNWVDLVALSLYWTGFGLRLHAPHGGFRTVYNDVDFYFGRSLLRALPLNQHRCRNARVAWFASRCSSC